MRPAFIDALVYGFASQAGLAAALWMLARLGRNLLQGPLFIFSATLFWNLGVFMGIAGILAGDSTGYELLEFPRYAAPILFFAYVLIGICAMLTFHARREGELYPSQWYLLGALLWFPWIYSTAQLLLVFGSVRGALQAVVNGWAAHNLFSLWLAPLGLATIFYFVPKLAVRPLYSRSLAIFGFWTLALFGGFGGLPVGTPVPKWLTSLSVVGTVLGIVAVLAVATNWHLTLVGTYGRWKTSVVFRFILFGAVSYVIASLLEILGALRSISPITNFTIYSSGVVQLYLFGFIGMTFGGLVYYVVPRMFGAEMPSLRLQKLHFGASAAGILLTVLALVIGGIVQGVELSHPKTVSFIESVRVLVPFLGLSTLGGVFMLVGFGALLVNMSWLLGVVCCGCCIPGSRQETDQAKGRRAA